MTVVSDEEADPIRSAITRKEAWTQESARRLRLEAERRMTQGPWSVTADRPTTLALDPHDYYSEAPYWWPNPENPAGPYILREGHLNPDRFAANRTAMENMCDAVFTLGTAAYLFDEPRYAQRASRVLQTWFLNPKTRMNPTLEFAQAIRGVNTGRAAGILDSRCFIRAVQGMEFLDQSGNWDPKEHAAVRKWFEDYLHWLTQSKFGLEERASGDSHASWWVAQVAAIATFVGDEVVKKRTLDYYRDALFLRPLHTEPSAPREDAGTSLRVTALNLEALATVCRIAEVQGVNLWDVRNKKGWSITAAIDELQPLLADPRHFSREQVSDLEPDGLYFLAFAGMGLKKPEYIELYQKLVHPDGSWLYVVDLLVGRWFAAGHQTRHLN